MQTVTKSVTYFGGRKVSVKRENREYWDTLIEIDGETRTVVDWLGRVFDRVIAENCMYSASTIGYKRRSLGRSPYRPPRKWVTVTREQSAVRRRNKERVLSELMYDWRLGRPMQQEHIDFFREQEIERIKRL